MKQFLRQMPKLQLHAHLGGSIPLSSLKQLLLSQGHLQAASKLDNVNLEVEGFFNSLFAGCALATETLDGVRKVARAVLEAFIEDGVVYLELRTTPRTGKDYTVVQYFNTIVEEATKYPDIEVRVIVSLNRAIKTMEVYDTLIEDIQKVNDWKRNIVGMDFCGDPRCRTFKEFLPLLHSARKLGLGLTIHTAQTPIQQCQTPQIISLRPQRIGHLNYFSEQELSTIKSLGIVIEVCISSNVIMKQLASEMEHHVVEFTELEHCLGSDDLLLFNSPLSQEFEKYARIVGAKEEQCYNLAKRAVAYTFDKSVREKIISKFTEFQDKYKGTYGFLADHKN